MLSTEKYWQPMYGKIQFGLAPGPSAKVMVPEALAPLTVGAMRPSDNGGGNCPQCHRKP